MHNLQQADVHACNFLIKWVTCKLSKEKIFIGNFERWLWRICAISKNEVIKF